MTHLLLMSCNFITSKQYTTIMDKHTSMKYNYIIQHRHKHKSIQILILLLALQLILWLWTYPVEEQ